MRCRCVPKNIIVCKNIRIESCIFRKKILKNVPLRSAFCKFQVRLRPLHAQWRYKLDVLVNSRPIYFDRYPQKIQHFPGVTVYTPSNILNQSHVVMMFKSGAGVEVLENKHYMAARVYLPWEFIVSF